MKIDIHNEWNMKKYVYLDWNVILYMYKQRDSKSILDTAMLNLVRILKKGIYLFSRLVKHIFKIEHVNLKKHCVKK